MTILARISSILLIITILISGCVFPINQNNNLNQSVSANPVIPTQTGIPSSNFLTGEQTASKISQDIDYNNSIVRNYATTHITPSNKGNYSIKQVFDIWDSINNNWTYVGHPDDYTYYSKASDLITQGLHGNCLNFAIVTTASIESIGGKSRVVMVLSPNGDWHAYSELYIGSSPSDIQPVIDYVTARYSIKMAHWHQEVDSDGVTNYWLNLDYLPKTPGGSLYDDNGAYFVYYPNGNFAWFTDSGYPENFPSLSSYQNNSAPLKIYEKSLTIPYRNVSAYPLQSSPNETTIIEITTDNASINAFILDQQNLNKFEDIEYLNQTSFNGVMFFNVRHRILIFKPASDGDYYLTLINFQLPMFNPDMGNEVNVTIDYANFLNN
jgi:hypothetical protein